MNMENVNGTGTTLQFANTLVSVYNGTSSGVNESAIPVADSLGAGFDTDGVRIVTGFSGSTPAFSNGQDYYASNAWSGAVTIAGSPGANEQVFFQISRDVSADDLDADARLLGIKLFFTTNAANDA